MVTKEQRFAMAKEIVNLEARRKNGHLAVYKLPANDGGGRYEVAGINEKYDKEAADTLVALLDTQKYAEAEVFAADYIAGNTDVAAKLTDVPGLQFYVRDCVFNRGPTGAVKIVQRAIGADRDGEVGPDTLQRIRLAEKDPEALLLKLRAAREDYELAVAGYRANMWDGLVNRWDKTMVIARWFPMTAPVAPAPVETKSWIAALLEIVLSLFKAAKPAPAAPKPAGLLWIVWGLKEEGFHEVGVNLGTEKYIDLAKAGTRGQLLGEPWCAVWANAGFEVNGIPGTRSAMARSFETSPNFVELDGPAYGCVVTMWRGSKGAGTGHVFYYLGENEKGVLGLGGNQSDSVSREYHPRNRIVGYYWPKSIPLPVTGAVTVDAVATKGTET